MNYQETQDVNQTVKVILIGLSLVGVIATIIFKHYYLIIPPLLISILSLLIKLEFYIDEHGVEYKCMPFHNSKIRIEKSEIERIEAVSLRHNGLFIGFKIKHTFNYKMYLVSGYNVLRIFRKNKPVIILSTNNIEKLKIILENYI